MIATCVRDGGSADVHIVAFGPRQPQASKIASHLRDMANAADLRNACAMTFYTTEEDAEREKPNFSHNSWRRWWRGGKGPVLRGIRAITILPKHEPSTCSVKYISPRTRSVIWKFRRSSSAFD